MLRNYVVIALRNLARNKLFSVINIGGLALGLAAALMIALFARGELSYDNWLDGHDRVFAIESTYTLPGRPPKRIARTPIELRAALEKDFPAIEQVTRMRAGEGSVTLDGQSFVEDLFQVEANFFEVMPLPFLEGAAAEAFVANNSAVITRKLATKYFGSQPALGRVLSMFERNFTVTGVIENLPGNSHLRVDMLLYFNPRQMVLDFVDWSSTRVYTYVKLRPDQTIKAVQSRIPDFLDRNAVFAPESLKTFRPSELMGLAFLAFDDVHLYGKGANPLSPNGSAEIVYGFIGIALLIIVIAAMNFVNLTTASAGARVREVAIRKICGASFRQLLAQHIGEALVLVAIAFLLAMAITELVAPALSQAVGIDTGGAVRFGPVFVAAAGGATLLIGILSAAYPAFHLSRVRPVKALAAARPGSPGSSGLWNTLVLFQFVASIALIVTASHFYLQTRFATTMRPGFDKENIVVFRGAGAAATVPVQGALKTEMAKIRDVFSLSFSSKVPSDPFQNNVTLVPLGSGTRNETLVSAIAVDPDFFSTYGIALLAGRWFDNSHVADLLIDPENGGPTPAGSVVINRTAVRALGFANPGAALGASFRISDFMNNSVEAVVTIVGVSNDANFRSIHQPVPPSLYIYYPPFFSSLSVKYESPDTAGAVSRLEGVWKTLLPDRAVLRDFLDESFDAQYANDRRQTIVFTVFAGLAILIACLGIFGLASASTERRAREVGIRKVLGASAYQIVKLFLWQFSRPVLWANLVAWPIAWVVLRNWLDGFAYRIDLSFGLFLGAGAAALLIAWVAVLSQAIRVARTNPVHALKYE